MTADTCKYTDNMDCPRRSKIFGLGIYGTAYQVIIESSYICKRSPTRDLNFTGSTYDEEHGSQSSLQPRCLSYLYVKPTALQFILCALSFEWLHLRLSLSILESSVDK